MAKHDSIIMKIRAVVKYDMTCIDIGAGSGDLSILMSDLVGNHSGYVYAYDADTSQCRRMSHCRLENLIIHHEAITDKSGPCMLTSEHVVTTRIGKDATCGWVAAIMSTTLDDIMDVVGKIDIVAIHSKVDGRAVRRGAKRLITEYNPTFLEV